MSSSSTRLPTPGSPGQLPDNSAPKEENFMSARNRCAVKMRSKPSTAADGAGTTSGPSLAAAPTLRGFNSTWWMAVGWLIVIVLLVSPYPWWW
jgi:hypothetical protein